MLRRPLARILILVSNHVLLGVRIRADNPDLSVGFLSFQTFLDDFDMTGWWGHGLRSHFSSIIYLEIHQSISIDNLINGHRIPRVCRFIRRATTIECT